MLAASNSGEPHELLQAAGSSAEGASDGGHGHHNLSGLEGVVGHGDDDGDDNSDYMSDDGRQHEMGIVGGHATNLDGLDKD